MKSCYHGVIFCHTTIQRLKRSNCSTIWRGVEWGCNKARDRKVEMDLRRSQRLLGVATNSAEVLKKVACFYELNFIMNVMRHQFRWRVGANSADQA